MSHFSLLRVLGSLWLGLLLATSLPARAQYTWQALTLPTAISRYDDMFWRSPQLGWVIDYSGFLRKTTDGGLTWRNQRGPVSNQYRSLAFLTDSLGFLGKLEPSTASPADTFTLFRTQDGGTTWAPVTLPGPAHYAERGFCGMSAVNDSTLYACGRFYGPANVYKTTNGGRTWQNFDLSAMAGGLVDCHFWTPDSGFVVGTTGPFLSSRGIILATTNGGRTWSTRYITANTADLLWKLTFPTRRIGYVSIEDFNTSDHFCLKTTDGGLTWQEIRYAPNSNYNAEGIGFITPQVGWIGGATNSTNVYETLDGGLTWAVQARGRSLNRFRFFGDTLGYVSGATVYRIRRRPLGLPADAAAPADVLGDLWPNPATGHAAVSFRLAAPGAVTLTLTDATGREVGRPLAGSPYGAGTHRLDLPLAGLPPGLYHCRLQTPRGTLVKPVVVGR